ncbi:MAG: efflux RND transporter periplasmic adaptor subunit, partial [Alistipes sp.]|nr:efflux RND transporter periplasmic adaptor subunit [Alistipes sp.]
EIMFQEGTAVRKGDLLAKVNDKPLVAQLSRYESQLKLANDRVYRQSALLEKDAVSQEAFEQARTELAILNAEIDIVKQNIALTELRAPFDGVVGLRNVSEGTYATSNVVVAKLTKISPLKIDMFIPERYADQIKVGTPLSFTVEGINETFKATVYAKESEVDASTRMMAVRATYPNHNGRLTPGRFVSANIQMQDIPNAIAIPTEAIVPEMGIDKVYKYVNGKAKSVSVKTGLRTDSQIQIIEGLMVGDTIITSGTLQLREDLPVELNVIQ